MSASPSGWPASTAAGAALLAALLGFIGARTLASHHPGLRIVETASVSSAAALPPGSLVSARSDSDLRWQDLARQPETAALTLEREEFLENLARSDPQRALDLAQSEPNWLTRDRLRDAALRGWAAVAPDAAADWAESQPVLGERMKCVAAVLTGAVAQPAEAVRIGLRLCAADPIPAGAYGHALVNALVERAGDFEAAMRFATAATMVDRQSYLLDSAFYQWAQHDPERALSQLATLTDPSAREAALKGVIEGRSDHDPQSFADSARLLPSGPERTQALAIALPRWAGHDPEAALQWINRAEPGPDLDPGISALAQNPALIAAQPELALELADSLCDTTRRTLVRSDVFFQWALRDPAAARRFAETVEHPATRETLLQDLESLPPPSEKSGS